MERQGLLHHSVANYRGDMVQLLFAIDEINSTPKNIHLLYHRATIYRRKGRVGFNVCICEGQFAACPMRDGYR
jgi:hypothetical protein